MNRIYYLLGQAEFGMFSEMLADLSLVLIGIVVTVFVLIVTLLGRATKIGELKKIEAEQKARADYNLAIDELNKQIKNQPDNVEKLKESVKELETKKEFSENKLIELEKKYSTLRINKSVLEPGLFFLVGIIFAKWVMLISSNHYWKAASFFGILFFLFLGVKRVILVLNVVSEVAVNSEDAQFNGLQNALINALKTIESEKEPRPALIFVEKSPLIYKPQSENKITFRIDLLEPGNKEARNVDVWFLSSSEIELIGGINHGTPFKQSSEYAIPNANTMRFKFDVVKKHTSTWGSVIIKTTEVGEYKLRYKVDCDNHAEPASSDREIGIIVQK